MSCLIVLTCFYLDELSPPLSEQQNREQILASLERFIRKEYDGMYTAVGSDS